MAMPRTAMLTQLLGLAAVASLLWFGAALGAAWDDVSYRDTVAAEGDRSSARVVEEGLARRDGSYEQAWVETSTGRRAFVDLSESSVPVFRLGQEVIVVVPPERTGVALPVDVVETSRVQVYVDRLIVPAVAVVTAVAVLVRTSWGSRRAIPR
jgi:hypothetical protein